MANLPILRTKTQIITDLTNGFTARVQGVDDFSRNSVISQFIQAIAQVNFRSYADIISMVSALSTDRATGEALQRLANDAGVPILPAAPAHGSVNVTDISFAKVGSLVYAGQPAPVAGSLAINVADGSRFGSSGTLYIGRGTVNTEGPLNYIAVTPQSGGGYWTITLDPNTPTTKFHNIGETVVKGQGGNRVVASGTNVQTPQGSAVNSVVFTTTSNATILDGEVTVNSIPIVCAQPGPVGNVPKGAIQLAVGLPFSASVYNPIELTSGRDADDNDSLRARMKQYEAAKSKGTETAIIFATEGVTASDELKTVQSANIIRYSDASAALIIDDGTGYEPLFTGSGLEMVVDEALGGEDDVQLRNVPIAQARLKNYSIAPYAIINLSTLTIEVDGSQTVHTFNDSDFRVPGSATAVEVMSSINEDPNLNFLATTADGGTKVVVYPKSKNSNDIQVIKPVSGTNANDVLQFSSIREYTVRLYRNDVPLYQSGKTATLATNPQALWSNSIVSGDTLQYKVDGCPVITVTLTTVDFQAIDPILTMTFSTNIDVWAQVLNNTMPGVTAVVQNEALHFTSNLGASNRASLEIVGGTLIAKMFPANADLVALGKTSDYTLNRQTAQVSLTKPLATNDQLTAGSTFTRAKMITNSLPSGPTANGKFWMIVDGDVTPVINGLSPGVAIVFSQSGTKMSITSSPAGFADVLPGDWVLVWANSTDETSLQHHAGYWRVETVSGGVIVVDNGGSTYISTETAHPSLDRIVIARSLAPVQQVSFTTPMSLVALGNSIKSQVLGIDVDTVGSFLRISTSTVGPNGQLYAMAADNGGKTLGLPLNTQIGNVDTHFGYVVTADSEAGVPSFTHSNLGAKGSSDSLFDLATYRDLGGTEFDFIEMLNLYAITPTMREFDNTNKSRRVLTDFFDDNTQQLSLVLPNYLNVGTSVLHGYNAPQLGDRFFLRTPYLFDSSDNLGLILDGDAATKLYSLPVARRLTVTSSSHNSFSADDAESSIPLSSVSSFYNFNFSNFLAMRRANTILTDGVYAVKVSSADFGPNGNNIRVGFRYPQSNSQTTLSNAGTVSDAIDVAIVLPVGTPRPAYTWGQTSSFTVSVTTTAGLDQATFTWRCGQKPDFTAAGVAPGDICMISPTAGFLSGDKGISAKIISVSATTFTVVLPTGTLVSDNVAATGISNVGGVIGVTTAADPGVSVGQSIGLWGTGISTGTTRPLDGSYIVTGISVSPHGFTVLTPVGTPGGMISGVVLENNILTVNAPNHGLSVGNPIVISDAVYGNGLTTVLSVTNAASFTCIQPSTSPSPQSGAGGKVDFQSFDLVDHKDLVGAHIELYGGAVHVTSASTPHGLSNGDIVQVSGIQFPVWDSGTQYSPSNLTNLAYVSWNGHNYISLQTGTGHQPDVSSTYWAVTNDDLGGTFVAAVNSNIEFIYFYTNVTGLMSFNMTVPATVSVNQLKPTARLARSVSGSGSANLQFGAITITAQEIVDYVTTSMSDILMAELVSGGAQPVAVSTEDLGIASHYYSGSISRVRTINAKQQIELDLSINVLAGATIKVAGLPSLLTAYNGTYVVLSSTEIMSPHVWRVTVMSSVLAAATAITGSLSVAFTGSHPYQMLMDGLNSINHTSNLLNDSLPIPLPQFFTKRSWVSAPELGEEIRLVAVTSDQVSRLWNKSIVSGLSNVATIRNSEYGRQLQIATKQFGSGGSIHVIGGLANSASAAIVGASYEIGTKLGLIRIPYSIRKGFTVGNWVKLQNTVVQSKELGFDSKTTALKLDPALKQVTITAGPGTFQTPRGTAQDATSKFKIEKHGSFTAFINVGGTAVGLSAHGVMEGDWVRIRNIVGTPWADENQGTYQVVRTFGDTFWVEGINFTEELVTLGNAANLKFYSYDSVMPGDVLVIANDKAFGPVNVGQYTVVDDLYGAGYYFPTSTVISVVGLLGSSPTTSVLGGYVDQVNVEEQSPTAVWKKIFAVGPGFSGYAAVVTDTAALMDRFTDSLGAYMTVGGKIGFNQNANYGVDAYRYYLGLLKELNKVIFGDSTNTTQYPGVKAAGSDLDINAAIRKRVQISVSIRVRSDVPFDLIRDEVRACIAGYVNGLDVGQPVSLSKVVTAAGNVYGVLSVVLDYPVYSAANDLISVAFDEKPLIVDSSTDVVVSILGGE